MNNFEIIISGDTPVLVDFYADWCGSSQVMMPILKEVKAIVGTHATILKMNIERNRCYSERFGILSTPTLMIFKNGKVLWRKTGVTLRREVIQHLALHIE